MVMKAWKRSKSFQHFFELLYMEEMSPEERDKENQGYLMVGMVKK